MLQEFLGLQAPTSTTFRPGAASEATSGRLEGGSEKPGCFFPPSLTQAATSFPLWLQLPPDKCIRASGNTTPFPSLFSLYALVTFGSLTFELPHHALFGFTDLPTLV